MKKFIASFLIGMQLPAVAMAKDACQAFFDKDQSASYFLTSQEQTCVVGRSAEHEIVNMTHVRLIDHPVFGQVDAYETPNGENGLIVVDDDLAASLEEGNEVIPFIVAVVAADLGILSAWMITDMYSR